MVNLTIPNASQPLVDASGKITPVWYRVLQQLVVMPLPTFTVAGLPTGGVVRVAFATNGRKNGETAGNGTGVLVFFDGTAWRAADTGATVAA